MRRATLLLWSTVLAVAAGALLGGARRPSGEPPEVVMSLVQVAAGALAVYLLVATVVTIIADATRSRALVTMARVITTSGMRAVIAGAVSGGVLVAQPLVGAEPSAPRPAEAPVDPPVLRRIDVGPARPTSPAPPPPPAVRDVVVKPGDHLWSIASSELSSRLGRAPTDDEIVPYWRSLIDLNRDRLPHPDDPDLILPGDRYVLP